MTSQRDEDLIRLLRNSVREVQPLDPPDDLWTRVRGRTTPRPARPNTIEWIVLAAIAALCLVRPETVSLLLFHF